MYRAEMESWVVHCTHFGNSSYKGLLDSLVNLQCHSISDAGGILQEFIDLLKLFDRFWLISLDLLHEMPYILIIQLNVIET